MMIADSANDSKALWSKLNVLLKTTQQSSSSAHFATDSANFWSMLIRYIQKNTSNSVQVMPTNA